MEQHPIDDLISHHPFFQGLAPETLKLIAGCGTNVKFESGEYLAKDGEDANRFYAIRHGKVAIELYSAAQGPLVLQTVGENEILGWSWLFPPYKWRFDARATEGVRATSFDGACLRKKCDADPALGYELMKRLAYLVSQRLEAARLQLLDLYGPAH